MTDAPFSHSHSDLTRRLRALTIGAQAARRSNEGGWDVVLTGMEVNSQHGTGVLLRRLFGEGAGVLSIRSFNLYGGQHEFGEAALRLSHGSEIRDLAFDRVLRAVGDSPIRRILCVPYYPDEVRTALVLKAAFNAPLCSFIMDDQNVCVEGIPDALMEELLAKSDLRLAISPELRTAYELKYGCAIWYMPPVVTGELILSRLNPPPEDSPREHGVMIGNVWGRSWLDHLRQTVRGSGVSLTWFCSGRFRWVSCSRRELIADSITPHNPVPDSDLLRTLRGEWFAVVPSGTLEPDDEHGSVARLSLPSRLVYLMATSQIPVLLLGSGQTGAANFLRQFGTGLISAYDNRSFAAAVEEITDATRNLEMRRNALFAAGRFSDVGAAEWIWRSLALRAPVDQRFEALMPAQRPDVGSLIRRGTGRL